jgi:transcriptional regulator with XRE-family HTH domain
MANTRLRDIRIRRGWSMKYIAYHIGVSIQTISNWEKGNTEPDIKSLIKIADLYGVTLDFLLKRDEYKPDISYVLKQIENKDKEELQEMTINFIKALSEIKLSKRKPRKSK